MTTQMFFQAIVQSLLAGSLYALLAVGYTVVYGILRFLNFAHSSVFMLAAYVPYVASLFLLPWPLSLLACVLVAAMVGILVDRIGYRQLRLRQAPQYSNLVSAIGLAMLIENLTLMAFGGRPKRIPTPAVFGQTFELYSVTIPAIGVVSLVAAVGSLLILYYQVYRTKSGLAMRALAEDREVAGLMGINTERTISTAFATGSALAAVGAFSWVLRFPAVWPTMGLIPGTKAFIAAVVGGVGNIPGALAGGFLLGFTEIMMVAAFPRFAAYKDVFSFFILIVVLLLRPSGLLGTTVREEKM